MKGGRVEEERRQVEANDGENSAFHRNTASAFQTGLFNGFCFHGHAASLELKVDKRRKALRSQCKNHGEHNGRNQCLHAAMETIEPIPQLFKSVSVHELAQEADGDDEKDRGGDEARRPTGENPGKNGCSIGEGL